MARKTTKTRPPEEKAAQMKVYLSPALYRRIKAMAVSEEVTYSHIAARIIGAFFRGVPKGYGDPTEEALKVYHDLIKVWPPKTEIPEEQRLSRVKIGDNSPNNRPSQGYPTAAGLSSRPDPEDNGPTLQDLQKTRTSRRS